MAERAQTQRSSLSFSIDNILRDDFPRSPRHNRTSSYYIPPRMPQLRASQVLPCHECLSSRYRPAPVYFYNPPDIKNETEILTRGSKIYPEVARSTVRCEAGSTFSEQQGNNSTKSSFCKDKCPSEVRSKQDKDEDQTKSGKLNDQQQKEKKKRFRSHFSQLQLQYLESIFARQHYLSRDERTLLANALDMTELQVRNWFQNKRYQKRHREIQALQKVGKQVPVQVLVNEGSPLINTIRHELRY